MEMKHPARRPSFASGACPRCGSSSAAPFAAGGICLRCAGARALDRESAAPFPFDGESPPPAADDRDGLPDRIGRFEIIEELGHGGMARVFAARQIGLGRIVALKAIPAGRGGAADLELRFLREAQTVARLRHPHIVAIHDSGRANGFVYFSMDYFEGGDLGRRLRERPFTPRAAAELLRKVAAALAHTHAEGVLHRDLKPSNILLEGDEPRVADFGLAAQLEAGGDLTAATGMLGTPHYVAPEALRRGSAALTVASDLYALGVILFEMLTGRTPFAGASLAELATLVENQEPPAPHLLAPAVPRDLETICLKCLEREPARRYAGAAALAEDLRRFLAGEPILARASGRFDRFRKFARRHRVGLAAATSITLVLITATAVSTWLAIRATQAEKFAAAEALSRRELADFLQNDLLSQASPVEQADRDLKLRTVLDRAAKKVEERFADQPLVEASLRETLSRTYVWLGDYAVAQHQLERAYALSRDQLGPTEPFTLRLLGELASANYNLGHYDKAQSMAMAALVQQRRTLGAAHPDTLATKSTLAGIYQAIGQPARAEALLAETLRAQQRQLGAADSATIETTAGLSSTLLDEGKFAEAVALLRPMLDICRKTRGAEHPYTLLIQNNLAGALWCQGQFAEAAELHQQTFNASKRILGPEHPDTLRSMNNLARSLSAAGRFAEAADLNRQILEIRRRVLGPEYHDTLRSMSSLAECYRELGRLAEAEALFREASGAMKRVLGAEHPDTLQALAGLGATLLAQQKPADAEPILRQCLDAHTKIDASDWTTAAARSQLGVALARLGRFAEAEPLVVSGYEELAKAEPHIPASDWKVVVAAGTQLVQLYTDWGRPAQAAEWKTRLAASAAGVTANRAPR